MTNTERQMIEIEGKVLAAEEAVHQAVESWRFSHSNRAISEIVSSHPENRDLWVSIESHVESLYLACERFIRTVRHDITEAEFNQ